MKRKFVSMFLKSTAAAAMFAATIGSSQAATQSFDVFANANSTAFSSQDASPLDTGIVFNAGDTLNITASGTWNGGACGDVGPNGANCGNDPGTGINYFALVGRVGAGAYFKVGDSYAGVASSGGDLFLAFLDIDSFNNTGFVTAVVTVPTPTIPEPETYALMLGGLGMLGFAARRKSVARG